MLLPTLRSLRALIKETKLMRLPQRCILVLSIEEIGIQGYYYLISQGQVHQLLVVWASIRSIYSTPILPILEVQR